MAGATTGLHQAVRNLDGKLIGEGAVRHVYAFRGDLIVAMDVED